MADLYRVDSPIDREQRNNLNLTLEDILKRFNNLQRQINILTGDNDVDELINRIADALTNSEATLTEVQTALTDAQQVIDDMITATTNATNATEAANQATTDATQLFNDMTFLQTDIEALQTSLNQIITDANQATNAANTATNNAKQATQDAQQATTDADNAASRANGAAESIEGWGQALPFQVGTYHRNNVVTFEGSTYQSLVDDNTSLPTDNTKWIVLARKGVDGQGAVQTVNDKLPNEQGNVELGISDIDGLDLTLNEKANDDDLTALGETVSGHLTNVVWEAATLLNGWQPFGIGYEPKYALDKHQYLLFKGALKNGALTKGTTLFILPEIMRPKVYVHMVTTCNNQSFNPYEYKIIELSVTPDGRVVLGSNIPYMQFLNLDGISIKL